MNTQKHIVALRANHDAISQCNTELSATIDLIKASPLGSDGKALIDQCDVNCSLIKDALFDAAENLHLIENPPVENVETAAAVIQQISKPEAVVLAVVPVTEGPIHDMVKAMEAAGIDSESIDAAVQKAVQKEKDAAAAAAPTINMNSIEVQVSETNGVQTTMVTMTRVSGTPVEPKVTNHFAAVDAFYSNLFGIEPLK